MKFKVIERRQILLVNPKFQLRFIGYMTVGSFFSLLVFYFSDIYFFYSLMQHGKDFNLPPDHIYFHLIAQQQGLMHNIFWVSRLVIFAFFILSGLYLSHRIAGPLYNLTRHLKKLAQGEQVRRLSFRRRDFFQEIPMALNDYVDSLHQLEVREDHDNKHHESDEADRIAS
ncbi:MAG: hypothetical protein A2504_11595 [Bdellovibrionales bacterium RIFOXYD12_FULL_39_22]|nr:MAG: hypothetical protein A2385_16110 [Bdellovibrionales bacterium RIFOXYB1_FULL_39_21]OFZ44518.1 MAG: hypothetical protein A2485_06785 [Bdellovibrionales bacterium RIFOXYC12_FULL_39_17]OFZ49840.1 MAG: hypothetical protein A2404_00680 [Bdellovibrionales bacterium RIFOXYC1_FULL_39_130]OFZ73016.1 MAG: hypothetical protein A2451_16005 [Bdellovibrionales bacterium RIFOXYC2_FULL_39_8]OFZ76845.1 MAG: hypothetical protein A2560_05480 [Bdellovibrionales bacterium RIFOXYD1_FULL_39_84]OFZ95772.1 MAG: